MSRFEELTNSLRESIDGLAEGWQDLWHKARSSLTRFTPFRDDEGETHPDAAHTSRWGVMSAELQESDEALEIQLEAPGMSAADFDISVDGRYLAIRGRKHYRSDRTEGRYHISERAYGSFERAFPLPCEVDVGSATYRDGVLVVKLPKVGSEKVRRITVE